MNKKGFTIIELLVVVAIIGLLTGIVLTNLSTAKSRSRDAKRVSDIGQIQLALELYFDRCDIYPATIAGTLSGIRDTSCPDTITLETFISKIPTDPSSGLIYEYKVNTAQTDYVLKATLEANNQALKDVNQVNHNERLTNKIDVNCSVTPAQPYPYCVQPR